MRGGLLTRLARRWLRRDQIGLPVELGYVGQEKLPIVYLASEAREADVRWVERWMASVRSPVGDIPDEK